MCAIAVASAAVVRGWPQVHERPNRICQSHKNAQILVHVRVVRVCAQIMISEHEKVYFYLNSK